MATENSVRIEYDGLQPILTLEKTSGGETKFVQAVALFGQNASTGELEIVKTDSGKMQAVFA